MPENQTRNEADILAENATLTAERGTATARVTALEAQLVQANASVTSQSNLLTAANAKVTTLESEKVMLTAERDDFKAKAEPVAKQLSAALVKHGIRAEAPGTAAGAKLDGNATMTVTQVCEAVKAGTLTADEGNALLKRQKDAAKK